MNKKFWNKRQFQCKFLLIFLLHYKSLSHHVSDLESFSYNAPASSSAAFTPRKFEATQSEIFAKPPTAQSVRTALTNRTNQSARTIFSNFSNLAHTTSSSTLRRTSLPTNMASLSLPKILRQASSRLQSNSNAAMTANNQHHNQHHNASSTSCNLDMDATKRRVSFGQIELNQLEIPVMYKHSNVAFERYKLNPNFYLPDGTLKRKFSLPKLSDTLDAVKNCGYLRRHSTNESFPNNVGGSESEYELDVKNIFKDLQTNVSEYDVSYHENV